MPRKGLKKTMDEAQAQAAAGGWFLLRAYFYLYFHRIYVLSIDLIFLHSLFFV